MSNIQVRAQQLTPGRSPDSNWVALRASRDGSPIVVPWFQALVLEGRVFQAIGPEQLTITNTPMTLLALSTVDTAAAIFVDIADGTAVLPLEAYGNYQATGAAIAQAWLVLSDTLVTTAGTETSTSIRNLNRAAPVTSAGTAAHTASGEADHISGAEVFLYQHATSFDVDAAADSGNERFYWKAADNGYAAIGVDGSSYVLRLGPTTSGTGWASLTWAELPESAVL